MHLRKPVTFALLGLLLSQAVGMRGQEANVPTEPKSSSVAYLDSSAHLVSLEAQTVRLKRDYHNLGFTGGSTAYRLPREKSLVRISTNAAPEFIIRLDSNLDPLESVEFYQFHASSGWRVAPILNFSPLGQPTALPSSADVVDFDASKYGSFSFKLRPIHALEPGEYCLIISGKTHWADKNPSFCFGIDASGN